MPTPPGVAASTGAAPLPKMADSTTLFPFPPQDLNFFDWDDDDLLDTEDLFSGPIIRQVCDDLTGNSPPLNPSFLHPVAQYNCACCQILREITHTNGVHLKRLEIHGVLGIITHASLRIYNCASSLPTQDCQMFDFHEGSTVTVKNFLVEYYEICRQEGYVPMQDPLSTFYEALSVGFNHPDNTPHLLQFTQNIAGGYQCEPLNEVGRSTKIPLSMQRERTRNLGLKDFVEYFHLPIEEAARRLNICPTVMKKICRKHGLSRWPYRKIKSVERKISKSEKIIEESAGEERAKALEDIQKYKIELSTIYAEVDGCSESHEDGGIFDTRDMSHGKPDPGLARLPFPLHPAAHNESTSYRAQPREVSAALWARQWRCCSADLSVGIYEELPAFLRIDQNLRHEEVPSFLPV